MNRGDAASSASFSLDDATDVADAVLLVFQEARSLEMFRV